MRSGCKPQIRTIGTYKTDLSQKGMIMWINAMSRVGRRKGITIPELLKQQRENNPNLTILPKPLKSRPKKVDPFEGVSTRELYCRRPMD